MSIAQGVQPPSAPPSPPGPTGRDVLVGLSLSGAMFVTLAVALGFLHFTYPLRWIFGPWGLLVQLGLANAVLALAAVVVAARRGWSVFRFNRLPWQSIAFCAAAGAVGGILLASLLSLLSTATGVRLHDVNEELIGVNDLPPIGLAIFAVIAAGTTPARRGIDFSRVAISVAARLDRAHWWRTGECDFIRRSPLAKRPGALGRARRLRAGPPLPSL